MVKAPFLPPMSNSNKLVAVNSPSGDGRFSSERKYTLVLDLDETLIHYVDRPADEGESYFLIRPFCKQFLNELSHFYEVVIFTAGVQEYADWVID